VSVTEPAAREDTWKRLVVALRDTSSDIIPATEAMLEVLHYDLETKYEGHPDFTEEDTVFLTGCIDTCEGYLEGIIPTGELGLRMGYDICAPDVNYHGVTCVSEQN
jgi:hypothetical protein